MAAKLRRQADRARGEAVRVLLLHGLAGSNAVWDQWVELADGRFEVWDAVLPWSADGAPEWSHHPEPGGWIEAALAAVPGGPGLVVGHSFAATALLEVLADRRVPRPVASAVVAPFHRTAPEDFDWAEMSYYFNGFHRILEEGLRVGSADRLPVRLRVAMAERVRERVGPYGWMRFFDAYLRSPFLDTAAIDLPMLVLGGEQDFAAKPDDARSLAKALPNARLDLFADCGHFPMTEAPGRFAATLDDFAAAHFPQPHLPHPTTPTELT